MLSYVIFGNGNLTVYYSCVSGVIHGNAMITGIQFILKPERLKQQSLGPRPRL